MNSHSDAIIVVQKNESMVGNSKVAYSSGSNGSSVHPQLKFELSNSESVKLFGGNLCSSVSYVDQLLDATRFKESQGKGRPADILNNAINISNKDDLISLKQIILDRKQPEGPELESYSMLQDHDGESKIFIVKRYDLILNDQECQMLNFTDITIYQKLKAQEEKSNVLSALNTSVNHEILVPLNINVELSKRLIR